MLKLACVAMVKNEARHIVEWLTYQYAIGFHAVLLLDNLSTDETKDAALTLRKRHEIEVLDWPLTSPDYQQRGYEFAAALLKDRFDWIAFFDTDEFLVLEEGYDLQSCLAARADAGALAIPWAMFGSSGHCLRPAGGIIDNFVHRSPASFWPNRHVKSVVRAQAVRSCQGAHTFTVQGDYLDLAGRPVRWQIGGVLADQPDYRIGKLHHYFTRSLADWIEKLGRGYHDTKRRPEEFFAYDRNEVFDDSAPRFMRRGAGR